MWRRCGRRIRTSKALFIVGGGFTPQGSSHVRLMNNDLQNLVMRAYPVEGYQLEGFPRDLSGAKFDVVAMADSAADERLAKLTKEQVRLEQEHMFQVLLADRFKLRVHWETREGDIYNLVVAKGGPKLGAAGSMPWTTAEKQWMGVGDDGEPNVFPIHEQCNGRGRCDFFGHSCGMDQLAESLTGPFGRPVHDKTGLAGKYDFRLMYRGILEIDRPADSTIPVPTLDRAVEDELGLKLDKAKGPVRFLVIDHIEKPTEN